MRRERSFGSHFVDVSIAFASCANRDRIGKLFEIEEAAGIGPMVTLRCRLHLGLIDSVTGLALATEAARWLVTIDSGMQNQACAIGKRHSFSEKLIDRFPIETY